MYICKELTHWRIIMNFFKRAADMYVDGFRNMTWGKPLWILILLKLLILFGVLRIFFFKPDMAGKTEGEKMEIVGERLSTPDCMAAENNTYTKN